VLGLLLSMLLSVVSYSCFLALSIVPINDKGLMFLLLLWLPLNDVPAADLDPMIILDYEDILLFYGSILLFREGLKIFLFTTLTGEDSYISNCYI